MAVDGRWRRMLVHLACFAHARIAMELSMPSRARRYRREGDGLRFGSQSCIHRQFAACRFDSENAPRCSEHPATQDLGGRAHAWCRDRCPDGGGASDRGNPNGGKRLSLNRLFSTKVIDNGSHAGPSFVPQKSATNVRASQADPQSACRLSGGCPS